MRRIGVLTSGGDAPGMNAAIRAVVRAGIAAGVEVWGVGHGYTGLIAGELRPLGPRDVGGIIHQAGTVLHSSRCEDFFHDAGRREAIETIGQYGLSGLVVVGGSGSQRGAADLSAMGVPVVGVASTIDNDIYGADISIGVDTALNIALEAIDRLKMTASSLQRAFLVEVMGRDCGYLALMAGLAGGAETIVIPEVETDPAAVFAELAASADRGKLHAFVVVAEGAAYNAERLIAYAREHRQAIGFELRATILGHVQRGGSPTAFDRLLATRAGAAAAQALHDGTHGVMFGLRDGAIAATPLVDVKARRKELDLRLLELARIMAT
ncbi:MAG TPA: ATP-dependent 6-phosphofructokinase [bacterium]|jgi:6-phosphofructokinase 1|nr:ATP-dependent 6-phosphofructokinase [bacterium]